MSIKLLLSICIQQGLPQYICCMHFVFFFQASVLFERNFTLMIKQLDYCIWQEEAVYSDLAWKTP